ncbi:GNAT family N-acetyltransferase [Roseateles sp. DAIF2]|uniref:GNAT family N-acetyltransferase n=1 Tax=Roseateles sp. DAIF2 TaxID=2714952 RepID=UPI0018A26A71|nr:GNAT family protein [Roseateles sp. DAIF2]QPF74980.1 GNAT family N-acetyltransferase [Roseateles sp. DAIF2]
MSPCPEVPGFLVRPIGREDAEAWARYACLPQVRQHSSSTARSADDLRPLIERVLAGGADAPLRFVLRQAGDATERIVATVGFHTISSLNGSAEIGYDVDPEFWGRGLASAACRAATAWGFRVRGWHRIQATTVPANLGSQRVLERCGYRREGLLRNFRIVAGLPADYYMYAIIPEPAA